MSHGEQNIAPDWAHVHFDVACARCGHDLHGQTEPICPSCKLEFDWAVAVPVHKLICADCDYQLYGLSETRCPECGSEFTWEGALDHYRRLQKPLFEYRWRVEPVRSLVRTWWWALWPPKIWSKVDIHDPPKVGPLLFMLVPCMVSFIVITITAPSVQQCAMYGRFSSVAGWWNALLFVWNGAVDTALHSGTYWLPTGVVLWLLMSLAALAAFPASMSRCRVRYVHILRVWIYATPLFLPIYFAGYTTAISILISIDMSVLRVFDSYLTEVAVFATPILHVTWSSWWAYKKYIRMRHSFWVAVSAQVMAVLATMTAMLVLQFGLEVL